MDFKWWKIDSGGTVYFLIVTNDYIGRLKAEDANRQAAALKAGRIPGEVYKIPFRYVTEVFIQEGKPELTVRFNKESEEVYRIGHLEQRFEVFHYLNEHTSHQGYSLQKPNLIQAAKKPLIAMLIFSVLLGWAYFVALDLEKGLDVGRQLMVVLAVAGLGSQMISWIYLGLMGLSLIMILPKVANPVVIHSLKYR